MIIPNDTNIINILQEQMVLVEEHCTKMQMGWGDCGKGSNGWGGGR